MDRCAVWRRGSLPRGSPGTTVSSPMPGEIFKGPENLFSSVIGCYMTTQFSTKVRTFFFVSHERFASFCFCFSH